MINSLDGKVALITGAGRGIGRATALELAAAGARVILLARSSDQLETTARLVEDSGGSAAVLPADLSDVGGIAGVAARAGEQFGAVEILVNNAATVAPLGSSAEVDRAQWAAAIGLNVIALATLTFTLLPSMVERRWGRIVNVSSGVVAQPGFMVGGNAYATSKAAVEAHTANLAAELADTGVTVNVFRPGAVDTQMQAWIRSQDPNEIGTELHERFHRMHGDGALITPEASARSLVARMSGEANGHVWDVTDSS